MRSIFLILITTVAFNSIVVPSDNNNGWWATVKAAVTNKYVLTAAGSASAGVLTTYLYQRSSMQELARFRAAQENSADFSGNGHLRNALLNSRSESSDAEIERTNDDNNNSSATQTTAAASDITTVFQTRSPRARLIDRIPGMSKEEAERTFAFAQQRRNRYEQRAAYDSEMLALDDHKKEKYVSQINAAQRRLTTLAQEQQQQPQQGSSSSSVQ